MLNAELLFKKSILFARTVVVISLKKEECFVELTESIHHTIFRTIFLYLLYTHIIRICENYIE